MDSIAEQRRHKMSTWRFRGASVSIALLQADLLALRHHRVAGNVVLFDDSACHDLAKKAKKASSTSSRKQLFHGSASEVLTQETNENNCEGCLNRARLIELCGCMRFR